jgi:hypothetical protein
MHDSCQRPPRGGFPLGVLVTSRHLCTVAILPHPTFKLTAINLRLCQCLSSRAAVPKSAMHYGTRLKTVHVQVESPHSETQESAQMKLAP